MQSRLSISPLESRICLQKFHLFFFYSSCAVAFSERKKQRSVNQKQHDLRDEDSTLESLSTCSSGNFPTTEPFSKEFFYDGRKKNPSSTERNYTVISSEKEKLIPLESGVTCALGSALQVWMISRTLFEAWSRKTKLISKKHSVFQRCRLHSHEMSPVRPSSFPLYPS
jgi:hypothetical protein